MIIHITAHCRDCFNMDGIIDGEEFEYDGYVPEIKAFGSGDDVCLSINTDTGKIIGWTAETKAQIEEALINGDN